MLTALAALVLQAPSNIVAGRYEVGQRIRELDVAWTATSESSRRSAAVQILSNSIYPFFANRHSEACKALDSAIYALQGAEPPPEAAVNARCLPPMASPDGRVRVEISWAYIPDSRKAIFVGIGGRNLTVMPGRKVTMEFDAGRFSPELRLAHEVGYAVPVRIGSRQTAAFVSFVKRGSKRISELRRSTNSEARAIGVALSAALEKPRDWDSDLPLIDWLSAGESLASGRRTIANLDVVPYARYKSAVLKAEFPSSELTPGKPATVVIAFHGVSADENMFFDAYGRGAAVDEALKRGWAFVSVRGADNAGPDAVEWLIRVRKIKVRKLFVMGHGSGAGIALSTSSGLLRPSAAALFAPAAISFLKEWTSAPLYLSVGKQDMPRVNSAAHTFQREFSGRADFQFHEFDPCEHLLVVADSVAEAYSFFDRYAP